MRKKRKIKVKIPASMLITYTIKEQSHSIMVSNFEELIALEIKVWKLIERGIKETLKGTTFPLDSFLINKAIERLSDRIVKMYKRFEEVQDENRIKWQDIEQQTSQSLTKKKTVKCEMSYANGGWICVF